MELSHILLLIYVAFCLFIGWKIWDSKPHEPMTLVGYPFVAKRKILENTTIGALWKLGKANDRLKKALTNKIFQIVSVKLS